MEKKRMIIDVVMESNQFREQVIKDMCVESLLPGFSCPISNSGAKITCRTCWETLVTKEE